jgi:hypothetical protein
MSNGMQTGNRFRCYPTLEQEQVLLRWIGCQRFIYNTKVPENRYYRAFARRLAGNAGQPQSNEALRDGGLEGEDHARTAIHRDGPQTLGGMAAGELPPDAEGWDAEQGGAKSKQGSSQADSGADGSRVSPAVSRRDSATGDDSSPAGKINERAKNLPALFGQSPTLDLQEASPGNIPALDFIIDDTLALGKATEAQKYQDNLAAIRTIKKIEAANRRAFPDGSRHRASPGDVNHPGLKAEA